jgi:hypothetical protein
MSKGQKKQDIFILFKYLFYKYRCAYTPKGYQNEVERRVKEALEGIKRKKQEIIEIFEEYKK